MIYKHSLTFWHGHWSSRLTTFSYFDAMGGGAESILESTSVVDESQSVTISVESISGSTSVDESSEHYNFSCSSLCCPNTKRHTCYTLGGLGMIFW